MVAKIAQFSNVIEFTLSIRQRHIPQRAFVHVTNGSRGAKWREKKRVNNVPIRWSTSDFRFPISDTKSQTQSPHLSIIHNNIHTMAAADSSDCSSCASPCFGTVKAHGTHVVVCGGVDVALLSDSHVEKNDTSFVGLLSSALKTCGAKDVKLTLCDRETGPLKPSVVSLRTMAALCTLLAGMAFVFAADLIPNVYARLAVALATGVGPALQLTRQAEQVAATENYEKTDEATECLVFGRHGRRATFRVRRSQVNDFARALSERDASVDVPIALPPFKPLDSHVPSKVILICTHKARDARCGRAGPSLVAACRDAAKEVKADVAVYGSSHIGGHKFAGVAIAYPAGDWYGLVTQRNGEELVRCVVSGERYSSKFRGNGFTGEGIEEKKKVAADDF